MIDKIKIRDFLFVHIICMRWPASVFRRFSVFRRRCILSNYLTTDGIVISGDSQNNIASSALKGLRGIYLSQCIVVRVTQYCCEHDQIIMYPALLLLH